MAEQKTGLEGSRFPRIHGLQRTLSFLSYSLAHSLARFSLSLSLSPSLPFTLDSRTLSYATLARALFLSLTHSLVLTLSLPPYLYLARSHLFVAGLGMLSWDSAAGFSEGTLPGLRP